MSVKKLLVILGVLALLPAASAMAGSVTYTVNWNAIPWGIAGNPLMPQATFEFMVADLATSNGTIPLGQITIINNPCGGISDPNPALYGVNTFSIDLNCIVGGYANLWKGTLSGTTANITEPGTYSFTSTNLSYFATWVNDDITSARFNEDNLRNYGGSVTVSQVPDPASTLFLLSMGLAGLGAARRRMRK